MHLTEAGEEERRHFLTGVGKLYNGFKDKARPVNSCGFKRRYKLLSKLRRGYVLPSISWSVAAVTASCLFVSRYHQRVKVPLSPPHRRHHSIFILFVWIESIFRKTPWCTLFQCSTEWCFWYRLSIGWLLYCEKGLRRAAFIHAHERNQLPRKV